MEIQQAITLKKIKFPQIQTNIVNVFLDNLGEIDINLNFEVLFPTQQSQNFVVKFDVILENKEKTFQMKCQMQALFETTLAYNDNFKNSDFVQINAPAIAFPYLRSFITNVTNNSGFNPIILPTINLTKKS